MASLVKNGEYYGLIWTDAERRPKQVRESLKTTDYTKANDKKKELEWGYLNRNNPNFPEDEKHDPWVCKWYQKKVEKTDALISNAVEEFIKYKTTARGSDGWSQANATKEAFVMRNFANILCMDPDVYKRWEKGRIDKEEAITTGVKDKPLSEITKEDLERLYYRPGVTSDHTRNSDYISMNTFLNWCVDRGKLKKEEKPEYKPKKPQSKIPKFIYPEDFAGLIQWKINEIETNIAENNFYTERHGSYWMILGWMVLAGTGMRPIELAHLKLQHIEQDSILIGEDFTTKVRSERRIPLLFESKFAIETLRSPHFRSMDLYMKDSPYLLGRKPSHSKEKISRAFSLAWKARYPDKSKRTLYNLKDFFCVRFLSDDSVGSSSGMKLYELKQILGHSSIQTTERYLKSVPYGTKIKGTIFDCDINDVLSDLRKHLEESK